MAYLGHKHCPSTLQTGLLLPLISFLLHIITYSDHFRANCLRNRSTAHSWKQQAPLPRLFSEDVTGDRMMRQIFNIHRSAHTSCLVNLCPSGLNGLHLSLAVATGYLPMNQGCSTSDHGLVAKRLVELNETTSHAVQGHPKQMGHSGSSDKTCSTGGGNGKPRQHSSQETPMNSTKGQKDTTTRR